MYAPLTHSNRAVVSATYEHLHAALANIHRVDDILVAFMPSYALASLSIPAGDGGIRGGREKQPRVSGPVQIEDGPFVS